MSIVQKVVKNTNAILWGEIISRVISALAILYLASYLGINLFGRYSFVIVYIGIFAIVCDVGIDSILVREISKNFVDPGKGIGNALLMKLIIATIGIITSNFLVIIFSFPSQIIHGVLALSIILIPISLGSTFTTILQVNLVMKYSAFANVVEKIIFSVFIVFIILMERGLFLVFTVTSLSAWSSFILKMKYSMRYATPNFERDFSYWKKLFIWALPIGIVFIAGTIVTHIGVIFLSVMVGDADAGYYYAARVLIVPIYLISYAFIISVYPLMSHSWENSKANFTLIFDSSIRVMTAIGLPLAICVSLLSDKIIDFFYPNEYSSAGIALALLIWAEAFLFVNSVCAYALYSAGKQRLVALYSIFAVVLVLILNILLIPSLGLEGSCLAKIGSEVFSLIAGYSLVAKYLKTRANIGNILKIIGLAFLLGALLERFLKYQSSIIAALIGTLSYVAVYFFLIFHFKLFGDIKIANLFGKI